MLASWPWHSIPWEVRSSLKSFVLQESICCRQRILRVKYAHDVKRKETHEPDLETYRLKRRTVQERQVE